MHKSPSAPEPNTEPPPGKATNLQPVHLPGEPDSPGFVYFAYCAGRIKIGYSADALARMGSFTTHAPYPVTLLLTIGGSPEDEKDYHEMFAEERRHNEWFHLSFELRDFLEDHIGDDGFPLLFEVEEDFYTATRGNLAYFIELMEDIQRSIACQSTSSAQTASSTDLSGTTPKRKRLERVIGPTGAVTIATKIPALGKS